MQCFQHGWYLATDFQMFIIGITLHLTMWRFPKSTKILLITSMVISYIIPGVVTYRNKFDGIIVIRPESQVSCSLLRAPISLLNSCAFPEIRDVV